MAFGPKEIFDYIGAGSLGPALKQVVNEAVPN